MDTTGFYLDLAAAYVRGARPDAPDLPPAELVRFGHEAGLRLHRFKRTAGLPRVRRVLGILPYDRRFLRPLGAGLIAGTVALLLPLAGLDPLPRLVLRVLVLGVTYLGALAAFGIDPVDREVARAFRDRLRRPVAASQPVEVSR